MKDAFDREIKAGVVVVYATRQGSSMELNVAYVKEVVVKGTRWDGTPKEFLRCETFAGTGYDFKYGKWDGGASVRVPCLTRNVSLSVSSNLMIANGIDVEDLKKLIVEKQTKKES